MSAAVVPGDLVAMTERLRSGESQFLAKITHVEARPEGAYVTYVPVRRDGARLAWDSSRGAWGCAMLRATPKPYGIVAYEVVTHAEAAS